MDQLADQIGELLHFGRQRSKKDKDDKQGGLEEFANWIETGKVKKILVLCGAGVSVSAGTSVVVQGKRNEERVSNHPLIYTPTFFAHHQAFRTFEHRVRNRT